MFRTTAITKYRRICCYHGQWRLRGTRPWPSWCRQNAKSTTDIGLYVWRTLIALKLYAETRHTLINRKKMFVRAWLAALFSHVSVPRIPFYPPPPGLVPQLPVAKFLKCCRSRYFERRFLNIEHFLPRSISAASLIKLRSPPWPVDARRSQSRRPRRLHRIKNRLNRVTDGLDSSFRRTLVILDPNQHQDAIAELFTCSLSLFSRLLISK